MKKRPILMNGEMVRAVLDGRKTQTRRVAKFFHGYDDAMQFAPRFEDGVWKAAYQGFECECPYGAVGEQLWVRDMFVDSLELGDYPGEPIYRATYTEDYKFHSPNPESWRVRWKPSIFMRRIQSRITLEITDVRVHRVQEISEADAQKEGCQRLNLTPEHIDFGQGLVRVHPSTSSYVEAFHKLWDSINAKRGFGWDVNPWVWAISFRRIKP